MNIIISDFEKKTNFIADAPSYFLEAKEKCENLAEAWVIDHEGMKYLSKPKYTDKTAIRRGYGLIKKVTDFSIRIKIYYKEPNGYIYAGGLKKVMEFYTSPREKCLHLYLKSMGAEWRIFFNECLSELLEKVNVIDIEQKSNEEI